MDEFLNLIAHPWAKILGVVATVVTIIAAIFKIRTSIKQNKEIEERKIPKFPSEKMKDPYFRLESSSPKSIDQFIDFFNRVDNEIVEIDIVICEDEKGLIDISKEYLKNNDDLSSDYLTIWKPYREFSDDERANASNSEGFALDINYTSESDARLFYSHGSWYLKGFFTVLPGFTNNGVCSIRLRAEKVQRRRS